jgi:hypothetical protein
MFSASATSSSFTATVMGHLARTGASDISSILIAKHDVQLQDLLDVLGEKLVKTHEVQLRRYKAELIEALDAAEAAAGLSPISASASPTRADAPDPPNPDETAEMRELREQISRIDQEISVLGAEASRRDGVSPEDSHASLSSVLEETSVKINPADFASGVSDFLHNVCGLLQLDFQRLRTEISSAKPSMSVSVVTKQAATLDACAARFNKAASLIKLIFSKVADLEQKINESSAREQALKFLLADMCDRGTSAEDVQGVKTQLDSEKIRLEAYTGALAGRRKEMLSALSDYPCMQNRVSTATSQKQLMDCSLLKHFGSLKPSDVLAEKSPRTASKLRAAIQSVLCTFSSCLTVVAPSLLRVLE